MVATAQTTLASADRPSQYIVPFGNTEPTCILLSGHFIDIDSRVLVHRTEDTNSIYLIMPHGDRWRFLVLIVSPRLSNTNSV